MIERRQPCLLISRDLRINLYQEHVFLLESHVLRLEVHQAAQEQSRPNEQHKRPRYLRDHQRLREARLHPALSDRRDFSLERGNQINASCP